MNRSTAIDDDNCNSEEYNKPNKYRNSKFQVKVVYLVYIHVDIPLCAFHLFMLLLQATGSGLLSHAGQLMKPLVNCIHH